MSQETMTIVPTNSPSAIFTQQKKHAALICVNGKHFSKVLRIQQSNKKNCSFFFGSKTFAHGLLKYAYLLFAGATVRGRFAASGSPSIPPIVSTTPPSSGYRVPSHITTGGPTGFAHVLKA